MEPWLIQFGRDSIASIARQLGLAAVTLLLIRVVLRRWLARREIQPGAFPWRRTLRHDLVWAVATLGIAGAAVATGTRHAVTAGWIDVDPALSSPARVGLEFIAYFVAFDLYFYGVHRALHHRWLYWLHRPHHVATRPNPVTAFAFNPIESLVTGGFMPVFAVLIGAHVHSIIAWATFGIINSLLVHSGHEPFGRRWNQRRSTRWFLTPLFHDLHHQRELWNYGGFTTIWDRLFGTEVADYDRLWAEQHAAPHTADAVPARTRPGEDPRGEDLRRENPPRENPPREDPDAR